MEILENDEWVDKRLSVNVKSFSREEAIRKYEQNPNTWKTDPNCEGFSVDETINYISNAIQFEIFSKLRIRILDKEAFEVTAFEP